MRRSLLPLLCLLFVCVLFCPARVPAAGGNTVNDSFSSAKRMLEQQVYYDHRVTLYCGASFDARKHVDLPAGFSTPAQPQRAGRVEWEHMVPAENFGRAFPEWREGDAQCTDSRGRAFKGRKCAEKVNMEYRYMQSDMYNLAPAIGSVNAVRSNKPYAALTGPSSFGSCEARTDDRRFDPPDRAKGEVARASLYMAEAYSGRFRLSRQQRQLFEAWDRQFPVTEWECTRARRIERIQGNVNPFVRDPCVRAGMY